MYFYFYDGEIYWGRHQKQRPHWNITTWLFRKEPMYEGECYISGPYTFFYLLDDGVPKVCVKSQEFPFDSPLVFIMNDDCVFHVGEHGTLVKLENKHDIQKDQFRSLFKKRLREYHGRYFLPIEKHTNYA